MIKTAYALAPALLATFALFAVVGAAATPASAREAGASATVAFADLDLMTPAGRKALDRRIEKTARAVCGLDRLNAGSRLPSRSQRTCHDQALQSTRIQVAAAMAGRNSGG